MLKETNFIGKDKRTIRLRPHEIIKLAAELQTPEDILRLIRLVTPPIIQIKSEK